ncbi:riboflavin synthase subunit beta [Arenibacter sp. H213]|uniref:Riboflavin synthase subunit beta n=1 Tax=Arenibacter antarcticus TaxID=2040469 RepID=A0ABW5VK64_9FLAO|nr:riboflavin synthase subunit beta [Arenibacter sp. H213]MCM4168995.1 riboflavin synthase subunit beta [Arenibacter sp. H213]
MGKFSRLRKNKKFGYSPRYYNDKGEGNPYKIEHKLDKFRPTMDGRSGLKGKFSRAIGDFKRSGNRSQTIRLVVIIAILVLIFLYIIDFDLSIFISK